MMPSENTLGLVGDGDELGLISDIEKSFGVEFRNASDNSIWTVGDLYRFVAGKLHFGPRVGNVDSTVRAYRTVLPTLQRHSGCQRIRPGTHLREIFSPTDYRRMLIELKKSEKLRLPTVTLNNSAMVLFLAAFASPLLAIAMLFLSVKFPGMREFAPCLFLGIPLFGAASWIATIVGGYGLSDEKYTVAWLARGIAAFNHKRFSGHPFEARDVWNAVCRIAEEHKETACVVTADTTIIS